MEMPWPPNASANTWWRASVNNGQMTYVVEAMTAADAAVDAQRRWGEDASVSQLTRGVYALHIRHAKFSEVRSQPELSASASA